jgi:hypothetical protein
VRHHLAGGSCKSILYSDLDGSDRMKVYDRGVGVSTDPDLASPSERRKQTARTVASTGVSSPSVGSDPERSLDLVAPEAQTSHLRRKRWMDLFIGATALIVLSPILALVAIIVRLDSPGPAFFRQTRIGMRRRPFEMWKFRTMAHGASDGPHRDLVAPHGAGPCRR